jgi:transcriptional regulator GlxA family with amidase domain
MPELGGFRDTLERSRSGVVFGAATSAQVGPMLQELVNARGVRRIEVFMNVLGALCRARDTRTLTSSSYLPDPSGFMSTGINEVLAYLNDNLTEQFRERDLASIAGLSTGAFSRSFRRHTGMTLVQYVNRLRINLACQLLMGDGDIKITDVCFASGFNNLSNFNRQFLTQKGMTPSRFRILLGENETTGALLQSGEKVGSMRN